MMTVHSTCAQDTEALGFTLAQALKHLENPIILLEGDLASGKTTFTKGIAKALNIDEIIKSPTYTLLRTYQSSDAIYTLHHFDLYRLEDIGLDFDLEDSMYAPGFSVIEWPFQVKALLPNAYVLVRLTITGLESRDITVSYVGEQYKGVERK